MIVGGARILIKKVQQLRHWVFFQYISQITQNCVYCDHKWCTCLFPLLNGLECSIQLGQSNTSVSFLIILIAKMQDLVDHGFLTNWLSWSTRIPTKWDVMFSYLLACHWIILCMHFLCYATFLSWTWRSIFPFLFFLLKEYFFDQPLYHSFFNTHAQKLSEISVFAFLLRGNT